MIGLFSDERLKDNVKRIGKLGNLNWYEWTWNDLARSLGITDQPEFGVIAQEVLAVKPEAVSERAGYLTVDYRSLV